jgi:hypothetical protein
MMTQEVMVNTLVRNPESGESEFFLQVGEVVVIEGFEEFQFALCQGLDYDYGKKKFKVQPKKWNVMELNTGRAIYGLVSSYNSKQEAIKEAKVILQIQGKEKLIKQIELLAIKNYDITP